MNDSYIIVGSKALRLRGVPFREPHDTDVLIYDEHHKDFLKDSFNYDIITIPKKIFDEIPYDIIESERVATVNAVFTLKCSHLSWQIFLKKHINDVLYLKELGCELDVRLYFKLKEYWNTVNGDKSFLKYFQTKQDFFDDYVIKKYDHDHLHEVISYPNSPLYKKCLYDNQEVAIDPKKFVKLTEDEQCQFFREETTVIAAERFLIPFPDDYDYRVAYDISIRKMLTTLTKDWQTDFIITNLDKIIKPDVKLFNRLEEKGYIKMANMVYNKEELALRISELLAKAASEGLFDADEVIMNRISGQDLIDFYEELKTYSYYLSVMLERFVLDYDIFTPGWHTDNGLFTLKIVAQRGGMDQGTYAETIIFFHDKERESEGKFYKMSYSYYSHDGFDFDCADVEEVTPKERTITEYV